MSFREVTIRVEWDAHGPMDPAEPGDKYIRVTRHKDFVEIINSDIRVASGDLRLPEVKEYLCSILKYLLGNSKLTDEIMDFIGIEVKSEPTP